MVNLGFVALLFCFVLCLFFFFNQPGGNLILLPICKAGWRNQLRSLSQKATLAALGTYSWAPLAQRALLDL